jgi:hypothetical protein
MPSSSARWQGRSAKRLPGNVESSRGGETFARFHSRPCTGPVALRGGRHGAATAPPARGPGTRCANGVGSAMASPPRLIFTGRRRAIIVHITRASTRSEHGTPGPRRRQARRPAAAVSNTPGCRPDERLSSRPRGAGWNEAVRGTGVPRAAEGAVELQPKAGTGVLGTYLPSPRATQLGHGQFVTFVAHAGPKTSAR